MHSMKIALVSDWFLPRTGGVEQHIVDLASALSGAGHTVEIVTATPGPARVPQLPGVPIHVLDCPLLPRYATVFRPREARALEALFRTRGYDLVHAHSIYSPLALAACWAAKNQRIPAVLTAHSLVRYACIPLFRALDYRLMWSSWPGVVTAVSEAVANDLRRASFVSDVHVLPNGLCLPAPLDRNQRQAGPVRIVCVSRLVPRKRPAVLLRAFAALDPARRTASKLVFVGSGPLEPELAALAREHGIADRVELRGWCTRAQVAAALAEADLFVLPATKEAFGLAALEAAAASLPVVTMRRSGSGELFTPGLDGLVAGSDRELTSILAQLIDDPALRMRLGAEARRLAERFDWGHVLDRTLGLYRLAGQRLRDRAGARIATAQPTMRISALRMLPRVS